MERNVGGTEVREWLSSTNNPSVRYLTARDLTRPRPGADALGALREEMLAWEPLRCILALQRADGSFPHRQRTPTAQPTFWALCLMERCGMEAGDEPVDRALTYLADNHLGHGAVSYTSGGSGILPCYVGVVTRAVIRMGGLDSPLAQESLEWLERHQRFDHKETLAGGSEEWPFKAAKNYGCWESVSCYHGVVAALRALAAVPPARRSSGQKERLKEAIEYLRIHRVYKRSADDRPLFRHLTQFFIIGDYRSNLLDVLEGLADADATLIREGWVAEAVRAVNDLTTDGALTLVKNYGRKLIDPVPLETVGEPSRFLTHQWLRVLQQFGVTNELV